METVKYLQLDFGQALYHLKAGKRVTREGWNGKDMFIVLAYQIYGNAKNAKIKFNKEYAGIDNYLENFIVMKTVDNKLVPWLASQTDILAEDWMLVE